MESETLDFAKVLDYSYKIAMVLIAIFNAVLTIYIFCSNNKKNEARQEANRKISLLKTLILDYNLSVFYESFRALENILSRLKNQKCNKKMVEKELQIEFRKLNEQFINFLGAVDSTLYQSLLELCDKCRDELVRSLFDRGVNLWDSKKYEDLIIKPLRATKQKMISDLFNYKGGGK